MRGLIQGAGTALIGFLPLIVVNSAIAEQPANAISWKAGTARAVITPDEPYWMAGYASRKKPSEGKLHDLHAKALAIESADGGRFVLVTLDLVVITESLAAAVEREARIRYGLPRDRLMINASHTHCGPMIRKYHVRFRNIPEEYGNKIDPYVRGLERKLVAVIGQALDNLRPARLSFSETSADFARNRRLPTEKGFVLGRNDDGPVDHAVPVLRVADQTDRVTAIVFGYACHNTTLSIYKFNGDYAGFAQIELERAHPGATALFVAGAGGDQNPYPRREIEHARQHGKTLADAVNRALAGTQTRLVGPLRVARNDAILEFQPLPDRAELEKLVDSKNIYQRNKARWLLEQIDAGTLAMIQKCPVQAVRFGDGLLMIAIGGEVVVDYALRIKREFPETPLWVAGYSNIVNGYLPSLRVLREGGYEGGGAMVHMRLPGPYAESVERRVFQTIRKLVARVSVD